MDRTGFSTIIKEGYDVYGNYTLFRYITCKLVQECVKNDRWFGFSRLVGGKQVDLLKRDISDGEFGLDTGGSTVSLSDEPKRCFPESPYRTAVFKYLLHEFLCYYEEPTVRRDKNSGGVSESYNKSLVTSNINVVAAWLDISVEEAKRQYGFRLEAADYSDDGDALFPYLKLYETKDGIRKITRPRSDLDLQKQGVRIQPLFAFEVGLGVLYKKASKDFYDVTFYKDSGQERTINICFSLDKLREIYSDEGLLREEYEKQYAGEYLSTKTLERGYIRVIEVGTKLSCGATRSINYARIIGIKQAKPDTTFVNIDLNSVCDTFINIVSSGSVPISELVEVLDVMEVGTSRKYAGHVLKTALDVENWVRSQEMLLSTPFVKKLALVMLANPHWFNNYTGEEQSSFANTSTEQSDVSSTPAKDLEIDDLDFVLDI